MEKLLTRLRRYDHVSAEEEQALRDAAGDVIDVRRGRVIIRAKMEQTCSSLLVSGFVHRFTDLKDGRRQSVQLSVPGDFIDLHSLLMKELDHEIGALSDCRLLRFPHERLLEVLKHHPHLGRLLWLSTLIDAAIHRQWIVSMGVRSAASRLAHLFCEIQVRLDGVGIGNPWGFDLPLTQVELAELLGMTPIHMNRMIRELRDDKILTFKGKVVRIHNWENLIKLAEFDPFYLGFQYRRR